MIQKKYFTVMLVSFTLCCKGIMAQYSPIPKVLIEAELPAEWIENNLNLLPGQRTAIAHVNIKYAERLDSIRSSHADRFAKLEKAYEVIWARDNELKFILTKEQFVSYMDAKEFQNDLFITAVK